MTIYFDLNEFGCKLILLKHQYFTTNRQLLLILAILYKLSYSYLLLIRITVHIGTSV